MRIFQGHKVFVKKIRVDNSLIGFSSDSLVFCEGKSDSLVKKSKLLPSLFCIEQREKIAQFSL